MFMLTDGSPTLTAQTVKMEDLTKAVFLTAPLQGKDHFVHNISITFKIHV